MLGDKLSRTPNDAWAGDEMWQHGTRCESDEMKALVKGQGQS